MTATYVWVVDTGNEYHRYGMLSAHTSEHGALAEIGERSGLNFAGVVAAMTVSETNDERELVSGDVVKDDRCYYVDRVELR